MCVCGCVGGGACVLVCWFVVLFVIVCHCVLVYICVRLRVWLFVCVRLFECRGDCACFCLFLGLRFCVFVCSLLVCLCV